MHAQIEVPVLNMAGRYPRSFWPASTRNRDSGNEGRKPIPIYPPSLCLAFLMRSDKAFTDHGIRLAGELGSGDYPTASHLEALNDAAAPNFIVMIEDGGLSGTQGSLRLMEMNTNAG